MDRKTILESLLDIRTVQWNLWEDYYYSYMTRPESWRRKLRDRYEKNVRVLDYLMEELKHDPKP